MEPKEQFLFPFIFLRRRISKQKYTKFFDTSLLELLASIKLYERCGIPLFEKFHDWLSSVLADKRGQIPESHRPLNLSHDKLPLLMAILLHEQKVTSSDIEPAQGSRVQILGVAEYCQLADHLVPHHVLDVELVLVAGRVVEDRHPVFAHPRKAEVHLVIGRYLVVGLLGLVLEELQQLGVVHCEVLGLQDALV